MRRLLHTFIAAIIITLPLTTRAGFQGTAPSTSAPPQAEIEALVKRFVTTAEEYQKVFLNLTTEETRLVEIFDESGRLDKRREIVSDLVVYEPPRASGERRTEYRAVSSVDGKPITKRNGRALELLKRASQSNSIEKELEGIDRESGRYGLDFRFEGATYQYGIALRERQKFRIDWAEIVLPATMLSCSTIKRLLQTGTIPIRSSTSVTAFRRASYVAAYGWT